MDYYLYDGRGVFTEAVVINPEEALPMRGTATPPPAADGDGVAIWVGPSWMIGPAPSIETPAPAVPDEVSAAQAKTALYEAGLYEKVETLVRDHAYPPIRIWWSSAQVWRRDHPYILGVAAELAPSLDDDEVDALFVAAAAVPT